MVAAGHPRHLASIFYVLAPAIGVIMKPGYHSLLLPKLSNFALS